MLPRNPKIQDVPFQLSGVIAKITLMYKRTSIHTGKKVRRVYLIFVIHTQIVTEISRPFLRNM